MCLISKWSFPKKAKEDLYCYKILRMETVVKNIKYNYYTPYLDEPVDLNSTLKVYGCRFRSFKNRNRVGKGYIHAYTRLPLSNPKIFDDEANHDNSFISVKCIIPKGTKYHISTNGEEICARKMYLTDITFYKH